MVVKLMPHQVDAVNKLNTGKILWGGVGTGKSKTAAAYYMEREAPKDVYVITTAKKRDDLDWDGEFAEYGVGKYKGATVAGILTVDSWNNIAKYSGVKNAFFIFDEQRLVGSGTWTGAFLAIAKANTWILLTATPGDTWLDYIPVFIANGFYKNRTQFKEDHVVYDAWSKFPKVKRYLGVGRLVRLRNQLLVEMPYQKSTVRHTHDIHVHFDKPTLDSAVTSRWNYFLDRPMKTAAELFQVSRRIVNSDPTRLDAVRSVLAKHPRLIVFYNFDYELEMLRCLTETKPPSTENFSEENAWVSGLSTQEEPTPTRVGTTSSTQSFNPTSHPISNVSAVDPIDLPWKVESENTTNTMDPATPGFTFQVAEWNGHKHEPIPKTDSWLYLVQFVAGAEGWNNTDTDATLFYSLPYSYKVWHQAHGRIDRLNTPFIDLHYYVLKSSSFIDSAIFKSLSEKRSFNEAAYIGRKWDKSDSLGESVSKWVNNV